MVLVTFCPPFNGTFVQLTKNNVVTARANSMSCADRVLRLIRDALFLIRIAGGAFEQQGCRAVGNKNYLEPRR